MTQENGESNDHKEQKSAPTKIAEMANQQKADASQHLHEFAEAVKGAADRLGEKDQTIVSQFVNQAAAGLESVSRTLAHSSLNGLVSSTRSFGRSNPAGFLGASVLAGLALGRFARSTATDAAQTMKSASNGAEGESPGQNSADGQHNHGQHND